jgi:transposase-like protein
MSDISCVYCGGVNIVKSGWVRKRQRYRCKNCERRFTLGWSLKSTKKVRSIAFTLYLNGVPIRRIAKWSGYSHVAVLKWIRAITAGLSGTELPERKKLSVNELTEMEKFIDKKTKKLDLFGD